MQNGKTRFRRPTADEQTVLLGMTVRLLVRPKDIKQADQILTEHHNLHNAKLVGEHLRYAVLWKCQWLAVAAWSAAAFQIKARDQFVGWTEDQRRARLPLVINNSRLCVQEQCRYPNLVSRFMKLTLARLSPISGVTRGYEDLADSAATLSQSQLRALKFHTHRPTGRVRCPGRTTFQRVLTGVDAPLLDPKAVPPPQRRPGAPAGTHFRQTSHCLVFAKMKRFVLFPPRFFISSIARPMLLGHVGLRIWLKKSRACRECFCSTAGSWGGPFSNDRWCWFAAMTPTGRLD